MSSWKFFTSHRLFSHNNGNLKRNLNDISLKKIKSTHFIVRKSSFFIIFVTDNFQRWSRGIYKNTSDHKNSPEMNELERDLIAVQFLASNFEKL